jgi:hypothetical protein
VAKRKKAQPWDAVFDRVRVIHFADRNRALKTTTAELDATEAELGFLFPLSYRAFAERFGLGGGLRHNPIELHPLTAPESSEPAFRRQSVMENTRAMRSRWREYFEELEKPQPQFEFESVVAFAGDDEFYSYFFHPSEVTDAKRREYRIYCHDWQEGELLHIADSFPEWLVEVDEHFIDEHDPPPGDEYPHVFKPDPPGSDCILYWADTISFKTAPAASDVALWLASNNHTARDLARSIRDHGRTDAFPILADALQEAGCSNADLLDSCRTGDPDIDGAWVLHVLLGKA